MSRSPSASGVRGRAAGRSACSTPERRSMSPQREEFVVHRGRAITTLSALVRREEEHGNYKKKATPLDYSLILNNFNFDLLSLHTSWSCFLLHEIIKTLICLHLSNSQFFSFQKMHKWQEGFWHCIIITVTMTTLLPRCCQLVVYDPFSI